MTYLSQGSTLNGHTCPHHPTAVYSATQRDARKQASPSQPHHTFPPSRQRLRLFHAALRPCLLQRNLLLQRRPSLRCCLCQEPFRAQAVPHHPASSTRPPPRKYRTEVSNVAGTLQRAGREGDREELEVAVSDDVEEVKAQQVHVEHGHARAPDHPAPTPLLHPRTAPRAAALRPRRRGDGAEHIEGPRQPSRARPTNRVATSHPRVGLPRRRSGNSGACSAPSAQGWSSCVQAHARRSRQSTTRRSATRACPNAQRLLLHSPLSCSFVLFVCDAKRHCTRADGARCVTERTKER